MANTPHIRNIALLGHGGSGKTTLAEAIMYLTGLTDRPGSVALGTTVSDADPEEIERKFSITASLLPFPWRDAKINLLDTPGYADFAGATLACVYVADTGVLVLDGVKGLEAQAERWHREGRARGLSFLAVVNKLDQDNANFQRAVEQVGTLGRAVPLGLPWQDGVLDVRRGQFVRVEHNKVVSEAAPAEAGDALAQAREALMEVAAEADDTLTEKYLESGTLEPAEVERGLHAAVRSGEVIPVFPTVGTTQLGLPVLLDAIVDLAPAPHERPAAIAKKAGSDDTIELTADASAPTVAFVFKTSTDPHVGRLSYVRVMSGKLSSDSMLVNPRSGSKERIQQVHVPRPKGPESVPALMPGDFGFLTKLQETHTGDTLCDAARLVEAQGIPYPEPVFARALKAKSRGDEDKVGSALARLCEEDATLRVVTNPQTKEIVLWGLGDLHLDVTVSRMKRKFGVEVELLVPKVPYLTTLRGKAEAQGRHKRQTGGRGQFGDVWIRVEPLERGGGVEFVDAVTGGAVPRNFIASVEKGVRDKATKGVLPGLPLTDFRITLYDGSHHAVDSSDMAFQIAGSLGLDAAAEKAGVQVLEPIAQVWVTVPDDHLGDVMGSLNGHRGRILGTDPGPARSQVVHANVPLSEMFTYSSELRSMTGGRASYTLKVSHYDPLPQHLAEQVIASARNGAAEGGRE